MSATQLKVLVTGAAGFIGFHVTKKLLETGVAVVGLDNLNSYYDVNLKYSRLAELGIDRDIIREGIEVVSNKCPDLSFIQVSIEDKSKLFSIFEHHNFDYVLNLAAQAGVRHSIENPDVYASSNLTGFLNILEACRQVNIKHLVYASSSSVYGLNHKFPSSETDTTQHPASLYAATKIANELMAHSYSHLYKLPTTGLRFFTVYGPWGRPDMAFFIFAKAILEKQPIKIFNGGNHARDFTYIDDIVDGVVKTLFAPPTPDIDWENKGQPPASSSAPYRIYNLGNSSPVDLMNYIRAIEKGLGLEAVKEFMPMQAGDVLMTHASISSVSEMHHYNPRISVEEGIKKFTQWFVDYYGH